MTNPKRLYRSKSTGSLFRVASKQGDRCVLEMVEVGAGTIDSLSAWADETPPRLESIFGDSPFAEIQRGLAGLATAEERLTFLVEHAKKTPLIVEPLWFEHAAVEERE